MEKQISIFTITKMLRQRMTIAEKILWEKLRGNQLGVKIRRQEPFVFGTYHYVADFYCPKNKLIIEIDGGIHNDKDNKDLDEFRADIFKQKGYQVIRFSNHEVLHKTDSVIQQLKLVFDSCLQH